MSHRSKLKINEGPNYGLFHKSQESEKAKKGSFVRRKSVANVSLHMSSTEPEIHVHSKPMHVNILFLGDSASNCYLSNQLN